MGPQGFYLRQKVEKNIRISYQPGADREAEFLSIDKFYKFHRKDLIQRAFKW